MKTLTLLLFATLALAQQPQPVTITDNSILPVTKLLYWTGTGTTDGVQYACLAPLVGTYTWAVTPSAGQGTLTSIVVATNVGTVTTSGNHGLQIGNVTTVAGSTTAALNGVYQIKTVPSATTFTITTAGVGDATYNTAALTLASNAPRSNVAQWSVQRFSYYSVSGGACPTGATGPTGGICSVQWATNLTTGQGGSKAYQFSCDSRATLSYQ